MWNEPQPNPTTRPALRKFEVATQVNPGEPFFLHIVQAHLVFDNNERGEGLVFRRYYNDSVRTEKVAQFLNWVYFKEVHDFSEG